jgi:alkanesulfonate monooxygenase SsuD/methylene tetrahydromethanopterin reductase-like flavin-dependent oxidoreductase (luciferase family)
MRFQLLDILPNIQNPVTGRLVSTADRLEQALTAARQAEKLGFDTVALGERHAGPFLSAGATVILGAIAAATSRVRIQTGVCVLSVLDPLRVAEDYATIDQLSRGRLELVIGKGNELRQLPMFGVEPGEQWEQLAEKYELLRRLWREEDVTWEGKFRGPLAAVTSLPRPFAGAPRVWHGSATTLDIDDAIARGPVLVGSPQQIIDKIMYFHEAFGHVLQSLSLPTMIPHEQQMEMLERLSAEVIPVVRAQVPTTLWTDQGPSPSAG